MKYKLRIFALHQNPECLIDENRYILLKSSGVILNEALAIENLYEIIITNYIDLEKECINALVSEMLIGTIDYQDFFNLKLILNTKIVNLLTAIRLYRDTVDKHIKACISEENLIVKPLGNLFTSEKEKLFEFRFMEQFRNYVQHYGIPVHRTSIGSRWVDSGNETTLLEFSLYYSAKKDKLILDPKFDKSILNEMPDEVNLCDATRKYMESISFIHDKVRKIINLKVTKARSAFEDAINEYKSLSGGNFIGLGIATYENGQVLEHTPISVEWDDVRIRLLNKNSQLINLSRRYVTNKVLNMSS